MKPRHLKIPLWSSRLAITFAAYTHSKLDGFDEPPASIGICWETFSSPYHTLFTPTHFQKSEFSAFPVSFRHSSMIWLHHVETRSCPVGDLVMLPFVRWHQCCLCQQFPPCCRMRRPRSWWWPHEWCATQMETLLIPKRTFSCISYILFFSFPQACSRNQKNVQQQFDNDIVSQSQRKIGGALQSHHQFKNKNSLYLALVTSSQGSPFTISLTCSPTNSFSPSSSIFAFLIENPRVSGDIL